ncbi:isochorismatase family protein [Ekhidna sp. To15]|uniref:isochorismatase family protein n=1 Tax=Ekhidna sp. To15 TaxID=3395267 RepID=UPI003F51DEDB
MSKSALIIIDVQSGMYNGERIPPIFEGEQKIASIKHLIEKARSRGIPLIYIQHNGDKGHPLEKGIESWKVHSQIQPLKEDLIIEKKYPDSFLNTRLSEILADLPR